ncbi:MAG: diguanylate cyclase and metal dependent phosphohydrolase [Solirubrobacterales bacterium]|nr:diguanylate cyclase and metal dependent phosphohydrolase [Solirubrobacterales bacterium]
MDRDTLTGLGDERKLMRDMSARPASAGRGVTLTLLDLEGFKHYNDSYGRACGDVLLRRLAQRLADAIGPDAEAYRTRGDEFAVLHEGDRAAAGALAERAAAALIELGEGFMIRAWHGSVSMPEDTEFPGDALKLADQRLQQHRHDPRSHATNELALREATRAPAPAPMHEAGTLAQQVGERMGFAGDRLSDLIAAAELRDVGMMAVPDTVVLTEGGLGLDDRRLIRLHTLVGERLLSANFGMGEVAAIVRSSHEQLDGRGYPDGLAGAQIPLAARIVFACGVFSDLTTERPHRAALSPAAALAELRRGAGTQFDPEVVDHLATVAQPARFTRHAAVAV